MYNYPNGISKRNPKKNFSPNPIMMTFTCVCTFNIYIVSFTIKGSDYTFKRDSFENNTLALGRNRFQKLEATTIDSDRT